MALKDIQVPKQSVEVAPGQDFPVRGLTPAEIQYAMREWGDQFKKLFDETVAQPDFDLSTSGAATVIKRAMQVAPDACVGIVLLGSDPADDTERAVVRRLPTPVIIDALVKILSLTLSPDGDPKKLIGAAINMLGTVNGMMSKFNWAAALHTVLTNGSGTSGDTPAS